MRRSSATRRLWTRMARSLDCWSRLGGAPLCGDFGVRPCRQSGPLEPSIDPALTEEECVRWSQGSGIFAEVDQHYVPIRNRGNDYLVDRSLQQRSSFTGITGISEQDAAIADSQGLIADRTRELLGQTDLGVVRFRELMLGEAKRVMAGHRPRGADAPDAYHLRSGDTVYSRDATLFDVLNARFGDQWAVHPRRPGA